MNKQRVLGWCLLAWATASWAALEVPADPLLTRNTTGKTVLRLMRSNTYHTGFVVISSQGTVVALDPAFAPKDMQADVLVATHMHFDHYDADLWRSPLNKSAVKLAARPGEKVVKDVKITGIASSHRGDPIDPLVPDNVLYVLDVDGLRIVHMGDCGQTSLSPEQLAQLGSVDVLITQFENGFSKMKVADGKGFHLLEQIQPKMVIATHGKKPAEPRLIEMMGQRREAVDGMVLLDRQMVDAGGRYYLDLQ